MRNTDKVTMCYTLKQFLDENDNDPIVLEIYGDANTGKTTFVNFLERVFGDKVLRIPSEILTTGYTYDMCKSITNQTRILIAHDKPEKPNIGQIKYLVSGENVEAGRLFMDYARAKLPTKMIVVGTALLGAPEGRFRIVYFNSVQSSDPSFAATLDGRESEFLEYIKAF
jgi:hypothetical protein